MDIVVGTAGHIDHGKTSLVKALTGVDADRLPEEKRRGITIDIGFAELDLGDVKIGFVDVPGHERFVKNMLAGASGIDLVILVIAADEGVMPQTREHFEICRLLGVTTGLVVLTKRDLIDEELLELVRLDVAELVEGSFLENAPVLAVSTKTGEGIDQVKKALADVAAVAPHHSNDIVTRLPVDRSFTVKGFGAVVTGTLASGTIREADELEILPVGKTVRVRGIQTHGRAVAAAHAGQRTAVNIGGIDHHEISRGMVLTEKGVLRATQILDAEVEVLKSAKNALRSRQRIRVHIGTTEALARVQIIENEGRIEPGGKGFAQLRLEMPVVAVPFERFIIRSYSPQTTIAGGRVLDPLAVKHRKKDAAATEIFLEKTVETENEETQRLKSVVEAAGKSGKTFADLQAATGWTEQTLKHTIAECIEDNKLIEAGASYLSPEPFAELRKAVIVEVTESHHRDPLSKGISREALREKIFGYLSPDIFKAVIADLEKRREIVSDKDTVRIATHSTQLSPEEETLRRNIVGMYERSGVEVPKFSDVLADAVKSTKFTKDFAQKVFRLLLDDKTIIKVTDEFYFSGTVIDDLIAKVREHAARSADRSIDVATFKDLAGISRKYAIPLLEYFDREKITVRAGEKRIVL
ncbi:MAG TPA: selenocysteine-specific translation elongation factor [Pyrinomonadaceae bacterium]|nr:selenocysteine-specific translation elongation factor [Pyrinomonadaceae bacterium]